MKLVIYYHKIKKKSALQIWEYDKLKHQTAAAHGYNVLTIWERDFMKFPEEQIKKCMDFINE